MGYSAATLWDSLHLSVKSPNTSLACCRPPRPTGLTWRYYVALGPDDLSYVYARFHCLKLRYLDFFFNSTGGIN